VIVVSDTTPLNYLVLVEAIGVLPKLFDQVYIPPSVIQELTRTKAPPVVHAWAANPPDWVQIVAPPVRLASTGSLGDGEADAISLAKALQIVDILIDERRGTKIARREGLMPVPTLAILESAAEIGLLDFRLTLDRLLQTNFRVPPELVAAALERDEIRKQRHKAE